MSPKKSYPSPLPRKAGKLLLMRDSSSRTGVMKPPVGRKGKPKKPGKKPQGK